MITVTDLFCGAGGSSLGAEAVPGVQLVMAANHWSKAIDVHQQHFPHARHDCADLTQTDPRRYPRSTILIASPECTNHSNARGVSRRRQDPSLWDMPDPSAERSRATMWDIVRFAEQIDYEAIVCENVVEAVKWRLWPMWWSALETLGYHGQVVSANSQDFTVPQSRDRIYVVWWRRSKKSAPDVTQNRSSWCGRCEKVTDAVQLFRPDRHVGRYRQQWHWWCRECHHQLQPDRHGSIEIIDWSLPIPRIGDRNKPLASATRQRIYGGLERHGWATAVTTAGAGNTYESTPGNRARPVCEPVSTQQATATTAVATPPGFLFQTAHGGRTHELADPHPTVCASDDRLSLVVQLRGTDGPSIRGSARAVDQPIGTVTAGGQHHALVVTNVTARSGHPGYLTRPVSEPVGTVVASAINQSLLVPNMSNNTARPVSEPAPTMTTGNRNALLVPYNRTGKASSVLDPAPTMTTRDRAAVLTPDQIIDDCGFRMLEPHEIAAAMAFPEGYIPVEGLTKRDRIKMAGNAVTPPVMEWIVSRVAAALEACQ